MKTHPEESDLIILGAGSPPFAGLVHAKGGAGFS